MINLKSLRFLSSVFSLFALPILSLSQETANIPLRVETSIGWNIFTHSGVNDDMRAVRDSTQFTDFSIPIGKFGRDYNLGLIVSTLLTDDISFGLSVQYYGTRGYYGFNGTTISGHTATDVEYAFSRIAPQLTADYSQHIAWIMAFKVGIRISAGAVFVNLRKDYNFAYVEYSPTFPLTLASPAALHIIGQYQALNPELGSTIFLSIPIINNLRFKASISGVLSPSKEVSGSFSALAMQAIRSNEFFKETLLRDINLGYSGITLGCGFEFGL
jgi:hypothetical protein